LYIGYAVVHNNIQMSASSVQWTRREAKTAGRYTHVINISIFDVVAKTSVASVRLKQGLIYIRTA